LGFGVAGATSSEREQQNSMVQRWC
jgi:hypothetical protein